MMTNMVSFPTMLSAAVSRCASLCTSIMMYKLMAKEFLPHQVQTLCYSTFSYLFNRLSSQLTLVIDESDGLTRNEIFEASKLFLGSRITPSVRRIKVMKVAKEENMALTIDTGEEVTDVFEGIQVKWTLVVTSKPENNQQVNLSYGRNKSAESENRRFELKFHKNDKEKVLGSYLPYVLNTAKIIKQENKVTKLYTINQSTGMGTWQSINLEHPASFDLFAIDQNMKTNIIEDLDRFVKRREFYKKVGKAWKRGYLLYGPPGTGKSTLVAAMANYLKFDIYDMELSSVYSNASLRKLLLETTNRSILLIEDIDCSINLKNREDEDSEDEDPEEVASRNQVTLSGLLNFVDGLWSSCGDERIIIFTTNHKDRLDQALLRPGRMDMHIHLSYCTAEGFNVLALNYLGLHKNKDKLYSEIENSIEKCQVTAAEVAEELMKSEDVDIALGGVLKFLKRKEMEKSEQEQNKDSLKKRKIAGKTARPRRKRRW